MILSLFDCCSSKPKEYDAPLTSVSYRYGSQMIPMPDFDMKLYDDEGTVYAIVFDQTRMTLCRYQITQDSVMERLHSVILDKKMYNYESRYVNMHVLDGWRWSFEADFKISDKTQRSKAHLSSYGSNAHPKGDGLKTLEHTMKEAMQGAVFMYVCNEKGEEIPDVPYETRHGKNDIVDFLVLSINDYDGRLDCYLYEYEKSEMFKERYGDIKFEKTYLTIKKRAERCYGVKVLDDGKTAPRIYLIVDEGAIESVSIDDIVKGEPRTTQYSITKGLTDVVLINDAVCGIDKTGNTVEIQWE